MDWCESFVSLSVVLGLVVLVLYFLLETEIFGFYFRVVDIEFVF